MLSKTASVRIYWLSVKFDWLELLKRGYYKSVLFNGSNQWKLIDLRVKRKITDIISENLTDLDLESENLLLVSASL